MPIPMELNVVPPKPQHPCTVFGGGAHGSGFGCFQLISDVLGQLNRIHSQLVNNKDTNSGSAVICNICFYDLAVDNAEGGGGGGEKDDNEDGDDDIVMVNDVVEARGGTEASTGDVATVVGAAAGNVSVPPRPKKQQTLSLSVSTKKITAQKEKQTNKKRKARKGLTIHEKLSILDEIKKGHATQAAISAKHGTKRCSLIIWKSERDTLEE